MDIDGSHNDWMYGRMRVRVAVGDLVDQPVEALFTVANARGLMPAGTPSAIRVHGGAEVERHGMALAPHRLGSVFASPSGRLAARGVQRIVHLVLSNSLGESPREWLIGDTVRAALDFADREGWRSVATPIIGMTSDVPDARRLAVIQATVDPVLQFARRRTFHLIDIVIVTRYESDARAIGDLLETARRRSLT